jgi:adenylylsulfate reductase, subunit B
MPDKHVVEERMPTYVDPDACNGCAGIHQGPLCVYICPNDLMILREDIDKGFNREPEMCSECYACVKLCPEDAIGVRGYADFVPLGASVQPRRVEQGLSWSVRFRDGRELRFTYPSRTTPVGSSEPYRDFAEDAVKDLRTQALAGESKWLGVDTLPTLRSR